MKMRWWLVFVSFAVFVWLGAIGLIALDSYRHRSSDLGPFRQMTRSDVVCNEASHTISIAPGNYYSSLSRAIELCGAAGWPHGTVDGGGSTTTEPPREFNVLLGSPECYGHNGDRVASLDGFVCHVMIDEALR